LETVSDSSKKALWVLLVTKEAIDMRIKDDEEIEWLKNSEQLYRKKQPQSHVKKGPEKQWDMLKD